MRDFDFESAWEKTTRYPFDLTERETLHPVPVRDRILPVGSRVLEMVFNRRINHFERNMEHMLDWLQDTADEIATLYIPQTLPQAITAYTVRELGDFSWEQAGFTVTDDSPLSGAGFQHPWTKEPLSDDPADRNKLVVAAVSAIDFLNGCGYVIE